VVSGQFSFLVYLGLFSPVHFKWNCIDYLKNDISYNTSADLHGEMILRHGKYIMKYRITELYTGWYLHKTGYVTIRFYLQQSICACNKWTSRVNEIMLDCKEHLQKIFHACQYKFQLYVVLSSLHAKNIHAKWVMHSSWTSLRDSDINDATEKNTMRLHLVQTTHKLRTRLGVDRGQ
jgi:hypothetical protein